MTLLYYILSFLAGALLAAVFTGGLWVTVQKMTVSSRPYLLAVGSFFLRSAAVMIGLYLLLQAGWQFMFTALAGFIIARTIIAGRLSLYNKHQQRMKEGKTNHDH
jgi:F1F0 ATPase subunit 2